MRTKKYKLLVLSDLKDSMLTTLESAVSLAKMIGGELVFFHVKNPSELVNQESQLSAIRSMNHEHTKTDNKIRNIIKSFSEDHNIKITYSFVFGNVRNEIGEYLKKHRPDIIVLGKKKPKPLSLIGDNIAHFLLKEHDGEILIVDEKKALVSNMNLSLGVLNDRGNTFNMSFADDLLAHNQKPLKSFKIAKNSNKVSSANNSSDKKVIEFVFEQGANSIKTVSNYISKNNINLLCMDRMKNDSNTIEENPTLSSDIKEIISDLNVSLLITGKPN